MKLHYDDGVVALAVYRNAVVVVVDEEIIYGVLEADLWGRVDFAGLFLWVDGGAEDGELWAFEVYESQFLACHWFFEENSALLVLQVDLKS